MPFQLFKENERGVIQGNFNPTSAMKKTGKYFPRITYTERPTRGGKTYQLAIEFSIPKLMFGNNFSEVADIDFDVIKKRLSDVMREMGILWLFTMQIENMTVGKIDFCKNVVFTDGTPIAYITSLIRSANISKVYDVEKNGFRNGGHIFHIHTNSLDISIYDKIADLQQEKKSPKRAKEEDGFTQLSILDEFEKNRKLSVLRFEVRLNGQKKIKSTLNQVGIQNENITFKDLFSSNVARKILMFHWNNIVNNIPKAPLDYETPENVFKQLLSLEDITPQKAMASLGYYLLRQDTNDARMIRSVLENRFGRHSWQRIRNGMRDPPKSQNLKSLLFISKTIFEMEAIKIDDYILRL